MQFELLTISGTKFSGEVSEVVLDTEAGTIAVFADHEPLTTIVKPGSVIIKTHTGKSEVFTTYGGILEVEANICRLLSDESEHIDELVESEIHDALEKAHQLKESAKDKHELAHAHSLIDRHSVRLNVARIKRRSKKH